MYFLFYFSVLVHNFHTNNGENIQEMPTSEVGPADIAEAFLILWGYDGKNETKRIKELREKLAKVDSYVIDRDKYSNLLMNEVKRNDLNATNFYDALLENDHFKLWNASKSLFLKLKEKMNRDDIMQILSERGEKKVMKYARRMMGESYVAKKTKEKQLDEIVDKYIAEKPADNHNFTKNDSYSNIWDPQLELEQRLEKHRMGGRRIFKGERTSVRYYPFVVSIHIMGRFWCGGSIYWSDLVMTSASCLQLMHNNRFFRENPRALSVRIGSNHSRIGGEVVDALEVYFNPGYDPRTLRNNIALIRLVRAIRFSYHRIPKIIQISNNELGVPFTSKVLLLGWGVTQTNQKLAYEPIFLQSKELPVYPNKLCQEVYGKKFVTGTMFCAGTVTTGEGACDHDAGGPAVLDGKLVGIISFGPTVCGFPDAPTVFTLVGAFTDWIETVNETMPGYYRSRKHTTTTTEDPLIEYFATRKPFGKPYPTTRKQVEAMVEKREIGTINLDDKEEKEKENKEKEDKEKVEKEEKGYVRAKEDDDSDSDSAGKFVKRSRDNFRLSPINRV